MLAPSVTTTIDDVLVHVDRYGMAASEAQIDLLARLARQHHVADAVVDTIIDADAPPVLRERAVARAIADLRAMAPTLPPIAA